jgi:hypothetical protein
LVVLLVAGVSYVALQAARFVGNLALRGIELAGTGLALGVRAATEALQAAGTVATETAQWTGHLFESSGPVKFHRKFGLPGDRQFAADYHRSPHRCEHSCGPDQHQSYRQHPGTSE